MTAKDLRRAYYPDYFSVDDILACQTLIECQTRMRVPKFGFLVPECNSEDLPVGINVQLPLWAARVLCKPGHVYVSVSVPARLKEIHKDVTEGDAAAVDLKTIHQYYYDAGQLCTSLYHNEAGDLAEMLPEILQQRIRCIGEATIVKLDKQLWNFSSKLPPRNPVLPATLDVLEEKLYWDARNGSYGVDDWLEPLKMGTSPPPLFPPQIQAQHFDPVHQSTMSSQEFADPYASAPLPSGHDFSSVTIPGASESSELSHHGYFPQQSL